MKIIKKILKSVGNFFSKWKKLLLGIIACVRTVFTIIGLDSVRRKVAGDDFVLYKTIKGDFKSSSDSMPEDNILSSDSLPDSDNTFPKEIPFGFSDVVLTDTENIGKGSLALINSQYAPMSFYTGLCPVEPDDGNYILNSPEMLISGDALPHLKDMLYDYNFYTEKNNIVIYNTTEECNSLYTSVYPENVSGYSIDIAVNSSYGEIIQYDGMDAEGWISENCQNYGFVTRFPEGKEDITGSEYSPYHFRYVGIPHAMIMTEINMCLEEYTEYIKDYTFENPLKYTAGDTEYSVYYSSAGIPSTTLYVPESGDYSISGNNYDGYIVSYSSETASAPETAEEQ